MAVVASTVGLPVGAEAYDVTTASAATDDCFRYRMDHPRRGQFIIINNKTFKPQTQMGERAGTDVDGANLATDFNRLGFEVKTYKDQTVGQMLKLMITGQYRRRLLDSHLHGPLILLSAYYIVLYGQL